MTNGGLRVTTATGAMLADPGCIGNPSAETAGSLFDPEFWRARGELSPTPGGRGAAWFIRPGAREWVLRHYRRGGFMAQLSRDGYWWCGEDRVRAFAEWRLLQELRQRGLPVPKPVAAGYRRSGLTYRCDLITERIEGAQPMSAALERAALPAAIWRAAGAAIARLHAAGVDHADLNAHNLLVDDKGKISIIDFDRSRLRTKGPWTERNLARLHRSFSKLSRAWGSDRFTPETWDRFIAGYREE